MKIVVENHIPYIAHLLEPYAQVLYLETSDITASALKDADVLITRTRTRCDEALLSGSRVRMIGTATRLGDGCGRRWACGLYRGTMGKANGL